MCDASIWFHDENQILHRHRQPKTNRIGNFCFSHRFLSHPIIIFPWLFLDFLSNKREFPLTDRTWSCHEANDEIESEARSEENFDYGMETILDGATKCKFQGNANWISAKSLRRSFLRKGKINEGKYANRARGRMKHALHLPRETIKTHQDDVRFSHPELIVFKGVNLLLALLLLLMRKIDIFSHFPLKLCSPSG